MQNAADNAVPKSPVAAAEKSLAAETSADATPSVEQRAKGKGPNRRLSRVDRRSGTERRQISIEDSDYEGVERRAGKERREETGFERRRGPGRRLSDERREAEEGEMNVEQFEFVMAVEAYKKANKRLYPTWTEILEVINQLGYRKVLTREVQLDAVPEPSLFDKNKAA